MNKKESGLYMKLDKTKLTIFDFGLALQQTVRPTFKGDRHEEFFYANRWSVSRWRQSI